MMSEKEGKKNDSRETESAAGVQWVKEGNGSEEEPEMNEMLKHKG